MSTEPTTEQINRALTEARGECRHDFHLCSDDESHFYPYWKCYNCGDKVESKYFDRETFHNTDYTTNLEACMELAQKLEDAGAISTMYVTSKNLTIRLRYSKKNGWRTAHMPMGGYKNYALTLSRLLYQITEQ